VNQTSSYPFTCITCCHLLLSLFIWSTHWFKGSFARRRMGAGQSQLAQYFGASSLLLFFLGISVVGSHTVTLSLYIVGPCVIFSYGVALRASVFIPSSFSDSVAAQLRERRR
jgi:hypothetical protein